MLKKLLRVFVIGSLLVVPAVVGAAGAPNGREELPAAVDQLLARDMIQLAQEQLRSAGFDPGHVDGVFDAQTEAALLAYQANYGLPRTGLLDEATRRALLPGLESDGGEG